MLDVVFKTHSRLDARTLCLHMSGTVLCLLPFQCGEPSSDGLQPSSIRLRLGACGLHQPEEAHHVEGLGERSSKSVVSGGHVITDNKTIQNPWDVFNPDDNAAGFGIISLVCLVMSCLNLFGGI